MKLLSIEDDSSFQDALCDFLSKNISQKTQIKKVSSISSAQIAIQDENYDVILLDKWIIGGVSLPLIREIRKKSKDTCIVFMTSDDDFSSSTSALELGVHEYIIKPIKVPFDVENKDFQNFLGQALLRIESAKRNLSVINKNEILVKQIALYPQEQIIGKSPYIESLKASLINYRGKSDPVLIVGDPGTGKKLVAKNLNRVSGALRPLIILDTFSLSPEQLSNELLGSAGIEQSWAGADKPGALERADGGDLLIHEVSNLTPAAQESLAHFLETGAYYPIGSDQKKTSKVRVIATTTHNLKEETSINHFNSKLWMLLSQNIIRLEPLKNHKEDIRDIATNIALRFAGVRYVLSEPALAYLSEVIFPGNIKHLKVTLESALLSARLAGRFEIVVQDFDDFNIRSVLIPQSPHDITHEKFTFAKHWFEKYYLANAMTHLNWDKEKLAKKLKVSVSWIYSKLQEHNLIKSTLPDFEAINQPKKAGRPKKYG